MDWRVVCSYGPVIAAAIGRRESVGQDLKPYYSSIGRLSVDPELMIRMLIIGYCFAIRSERRLCDEVHVYLAYCWFCRLDLNGRCRIIRPSRRTVMAVFARAMFSAMSSRR